jgi:4-hydroxybenzoate polyprenyltransferase
MFSRLGRFFANEFLYNGHLQSLGATGIVYISSQFIAEKSPSFDLLIIVYFIFQFIFMNDRYKDISLDSATNAQRTMHLRKYLNKIPTVLGIFLLVVLILNLYFSTIHSLIFSLTIMLLGFLYPIYFKDLTKKIYLLKNFYVSSVFAILVYFPLVYYSAKLTETKTFLIFLAFVFIESLINQIALDLKDLVADRKLKFLTLPVVLGREKSLNLLRTFSLISSAIFIFLVFHYQIESIFAILIVASAFINQLFLTMIYERRKTGYAIVAGKFSLWLLLVLTINVLI